AYLRLLPAWVSLAAVEYHRRRRIPLVVNVHPWEIDPGQPSVGFSRLAKWAHYARLDQTDRILRRVLHLGGFSTIEARLRELSLHLTQGPVARAILFGPQSLDHMLQQYWPGMSRLSGPGASQLVGKPLTSFHGIGREIAPGESHHDPLRLP